jgi:hypothetical protein
MASVGARADRRLPRNVTIGCWLCGMMHLATYQQAMTQTRNDAGKTFHSYLREKTLTGVWPHRPSRLQHRLMPHLSYGMYLHQINLSHLWYFGFACTMDALHCLTAFEIWYRIRSFQRLPISGLSCKPLSIFWFILQYLHRF